VRGSLTSAFWSSRECRYFVRAEASSRRDALRWIPRRERDSYHIEITALIDGLLAAARGGSPSVKLVR
jgi:hypothetical protein